MLVLVVSLLIPGMTEMPENRSAAESRDPLAAAAPRIPLAGDDHVAGAARPPVTIDPACASGCIARVDVGSADRALWSRDGVAYAAIEPDDLARLTDADARPVVVWPGHDTLPLYVMFKVRPDQDALIEQVGTIRDRIGSVRLVEANDLPLHVGRLYDAGIWVEKLPPSANPGGGAPVDLKQTIADLESIGGKDGRPPGDRQFDGPGTVEAAAYLFARFAALGYDVRYADFVDPEGHQQLNVVADPPGHVPSSRDMLITAHYDSISPAGQPAPGADDNASGVAVMLEIAARAAAGGFVEPVRFVGFGAEEPGLFGSAAYAQDLAEQHVPLAGAINLDSIGIPNDGNVYINGDDASRWIYRGLVDLSGDAYWLEWMENPNFLSDDEYLRRYGYPAVMVTTHPWGTEPLHHTPDDRLEHVDIAQVRDLTDLIWSWITHQTAS